MICCATPVTSHTVTRLASAVDLTSRIASGQVEAGMACGMSRGLLLRRIIAPVMLRYALPA
jgi:ABC-type arginine transport system permease subunit